MEMCKTQSSKLFVYTTVDIKDDFEEKYERAYQNLQNISSGLSDKEFHELVQSCKDKQYEEIFMGLLYTILTDVNLASKTYRDLTLLTNDGLQFITTNLSILVAEKYVKFTDIARKQLLWLLRELIKNQVLNVDGIVWNILRQASGGDVSLKNIHLIEGILDILIDHRPWLEKFPFLIGTVVYTFVRLIEDHQSPQLTNLRNKEVKFTISLIRDRFPDVIPLGRDFVRLLQNVARLPEFEQLWKDVLLNPKTLCPTFTGVWQLLQTRTSRRFLQSRLTPDVERKIHFLTSSVKFGNHKRYQDWFQDRYFITPESHSLRADLIRYIINAIHPTNDMLCSDIMPRWAIIGWLLTSCTNPIALANAKLALFYDWLFFDPVKDNIMNIEPGILVMYHSIRNHPLVSSTLLDFLCRIIKNFFPKNEDKIRAGVYNSFRKILEKQVIPDLIPLFESPKLDRELKNLIRENFREFTNSTSATPTAINDITTNFTINDETNKLIQRVPMMIGNYEENNRIPITAHNNYIAGIIGTGSIIESKAAIRYENCNSTEVSNNQTSSDGNESAGEHDNDAEFSDEDEKEHNSSKPDDLTDDDDDLPLSKVRLKEKQGAPEKVDLPVAITTSFQKFLTTKTQNDLETFLLDLKTISSLEQDQENYVYNNIYQIIKVTLPKSPFPETKHDDKLNESISYPIYGLFKIMHQFEDKCKKIIINLLKYLKLHKINSIGFMLLYFLKVYMKLQSRKNPNTNHTFKSNLYKIYCDSIDETIETQLIYDLDLLEKENSQMFLWLMPDIYREFKNQMINNCNIIKILVGCVDAKNLRDLIYNITQGKLVIFKNAGIIDCVRDSLTYETFEQFCMWQLIQAHDVPIEYLQELLPDLESSNHAEALTSMLMMLKYEKPTHELIRLLLSREAKNRGDSFVTSALRYWCQEYEEVLSEIIGSLLTSKYPGSSPNKRKRPLKNNSAQNSMPTADQLLCHLEHFRRSCRHGNGTGTGLYVQDSMQRALQQAFAHSSDSTKKQYSDLFALAAEDETSGVGRRGTSGRGRKPPPNKKDSNNSSTSNNKKNSEPITSIIFSSDEEESDEDWSKPKAAKRRKKAISDSD